MKQRGWIVRVATVAAITSSLALAVVGGVIFGEAVSTPAKYSPRVGEGPELTVEAPDPRKKKSEEWPAQGTAAKAVRVARTRSGVVSFAAIGPDGTTVSFEPNRQFFSASVSKAMLLVAELRRLRREEAPLDDATRAMLERMISFSDNAAADAVYERVGDPGLNEVAELSGMTSFGGDVGHWSNVKVTAGDLARFMSKLDELLDLPGGKAGGEMLGAIVPEQSWGIPQAAPDGARVRFKGGWRPSDAGQLVHQMARVDLGGESYSLAVMTDGNPSMRYGEDTIRRIAAELLR